MKQKKQEKIIQINVALSEEDAIALTNSVPDEYGSPIDKLSGVATALLQEQAGGGMMLSGEVMEMVQTVTGHLGEGADLVPWVEKAGNKDGDATIVSWRVDPTYYPLLENIAAGQGRPVEQVIQEILDWVLGQGWGYDFSFATTTIPFENADAEWLRQQIGKEHLTSSNVIAYFKDLAQDRQAMVEVSKR